jgi:uncharacterized protein YsxB (DUF464 family)
MTDNNHNFYKVCSALSNQKNMLFILHVHKLKRKSSAKPVVLAGFTFNQVGELQKQYDEDIN